MRNKLKFMAAVFTAIFALSGITAFAQSSETAVKPTALPSEIVIEDNKNLTPDGNAQLLDDVTDNKDLQFITVTARDGNVFYIVIDRGATSQNVYFLNTVDEGDLSALVEDYTPKTATGAETAKPETEESSEKDKTETTSKEQEPEKEQKPTSQKQSNNGMLYVLLGLAAIAGIGGYYFKVILPKKKLEQADDIEDFEFEDDENTVNEDEKADVDNE